MAIIHKATIFVYFIIFMLISSILCFSINYNGKEEKMKNSQSYVPRKNKYDPKNMEYVLEVIGLGVTLDKYRQGTLWNAIEEGSAYETIRDMNPKNYPWKDSDKINQSGSREGASLENAILDMPRYWGIPAFTNLLESKASS